MHAQPYCKPGPRPRHRAVKYEGATTVSGNVGTRQELMCEVHGPTASRGPRCWHLRPRKHSYPSASGPQLFSRRENAWVKIQLFLKQRANAHALLSYDKKKGAAGGLLTCFLLLWKIRRKVNFSYVYIQLQMFRTCGSCGRAELHKLGWACAARDVPPVVLKRELRETRSHCCVRRERTTSCALDSVSRTQ